MINSSDITEVKECFRAGDDAKLLDAFQRFSASDKWSTSCHRWGEENAEELSAFIQHIVPLLPVSTPVDVVGELCRNYMLGLAQLPQSIDIAKKCLSISGIVNGQKKMMMWLVSSRLC